VKIPGNPAFSVAVGDFQILLDVSGDLTLDAKTDVRFQLDFRNYPDPQQRPLIIVDNCQLRKALD
jgi:hypothetical protein